MVDDLNDRGEKDPKAVDVSPVPELLDAAQYSGVAGQSKQSVSGHFFGQAPYFNLGELYRRGRLVED